MFELGKTLKTTRNRKFLTIEEVSNITKIKEHYLVALEEEDLSSLPARVYAVGFINNLADLYDLSAAELILAYDRLKDNGDKGKIKREFTNPNIEPYNRSPGRSYDDIQLSDYDKDVNVKPETFNETFSRIKKLSLDDEETNDGSMSLIDNYIETSKDELKAISIINETERSKSDTAHDDDQENTEPTSKVMLEFEELIREEERFNTQKLRKLEAERNINKTKNRVAQNKGFGVNYESKSGAGAMVLILLSVAILVLLYIIIKALLTR